MTDCFPAALDFTRREEGGYSCDPIDAGNWTTGVSGHGRLVGSCWGVGAPALISWVGPAKADQVTPDLMRKLPEKTYAAIARSRYWRTMGCDGLPDAVALMVFDFGWNAGDATSVKILQRVCGVNADGDCGPSTTKRATELSTVSVVHQLAAAQSNHYRLLHNFDVYGEGWLARTRRRLTAAFASVG